MEEETRTIYLDSDFKCHVESGEGLIPYETPFFIGKCDAYIEGYRCVPEGETWTRGDGMIFSGEMYAPWTDWNNLNALQAQYDAGVESNGN